MYIHDITSGFNILFHEYVSLLISSFLCVDFIKILQSDIYILIFIASSLYKLVEYCREES